MKAAFSILSVMVLLLVGCSRSAYYAHPAFDRQYVMNDSVMPDVDSSIYRLADPYRIQLKSTMSEVLARSSAPMVKGNPEGELGNFAADAALSEANQLARKMGLDTASWVVLNNGGLRKSLPAGEITLSDLYEVFPFENKLEILTCSGSTASSLLRYIASMNGTPVAGLSLVMHSADSTIKSVSVGGQRFDSTLTYRILTVDYLANGGDRFTMFNEALHRETLDEKLRDVMIHYVREFGKSGQEIVPVKDGRIRYE